MRLDLSCQHTLHEVLANREHHGLIGVDAPAMHGTADGIFGQPECKLELSVHHEVNEEFLYFMSQAIQRQHMSHGISCAKADFFADGLVGQW